MLRDCRRVFTLRGGVESEEVGIRGYSRDREGQGNECVAEESQREHTHAGIVKHSKVQQI